MYVLRAKLFFVEPKFGVAPSRPSKHPARTPNGRPPSPVPQVSASPSSSTSAWRAASGVVPKANLVEKIQIPPLSFSLQPPEEQTDNWDDDFEEGISLTKLQGSSLSSSSILCSNPRSARETTRRRRNYVFRGKCENDPAQQEPCGQVANSTGEAAVRRDT
jgi:hypothetical protein